MAIDTENPNMVIMVKILQAATAYRDDEIRVRKSLVRLHCGKSKFFTFTLGYFLQCWAMILISSQFPSQSWVLLYYVSRLQCHGFSVLVGITLTFNQYISVTSQHSWPDFRTWHDQENVQLPLITCWCHFSILQLSSPNLLISLNICMRG